MSLKIRFRSKNVMNMNCCMIILSTSLMLHSSILASFQSISIKSCWSHRSTIEENKDHEKRRHRICWFAKEFSIMLSINHAHALFGMNSTKKKMGVHMLCALYVKIRVSHHV